MWYWIWILCCENYLFTYYLFPLLIDKPARLTIRVLWVLVSDSIFWLYLSNQKWKANLRRRWQCLLYDDDNIGRGMQCILYIRMKIDSGDIFRYPIPYHLHTIAMILGKTHIHRLKNETPLLSHHNIIAEQDGCHKVKLETWF